VGSDSLGVDRPTDGPPRAVFIAAVVVAVAAVGTVLAIAATREPTRTPVPIAAVPAPAAGDSSCTALMKALPEQLGDYRRAAAAEPVPQGAAAWQADPGTDPVVLRCGLDRPTDFVVGTPLQMVDEVSWFRVAESDHLVRGGPPGVHRADPAARLRPHAHPGALRCDRQDAARTADRAGPGPITLSRSASVGGKP
jgi:hypothetical protein